MRLNSMIFYQKSAGKAEKRLFGQILLLCS